MNKQKLASQMGFDVIKGAKEFASQKERISWGLSDQALYKGFIEVLKGRKKNVTHPWFASLLTVSTHHPYDIPSTEGGFLNAFRYADSQIKFLIDELKNIGEYKNTVIFITSDEVSTINEFRSENIIHENHIPLIVLGNKIKKIRSDLPFSQIDLAPSILDLLGITAQDDFGGQSFFSENLKENTVFAGMIHSRYVFKLNSDLSLIACNRIGTCQLYEEYDLENEHGPKKIKNLSKSQSSSQMKKFRELEKLY